MSSEKMRPPRTSSPIGKKKKFMSRGRQILEKSRVANIGRIPCEKKGISELDILGCLTNGLDDTLSTIQPVSDLVKRNDCGSPEHVKVPIRLVQYSDTDSIDSPLVEKAVQHRVVPGDAAQSWPNSKSLTPVITQNQTLTARKLDEENIPGYFKVMEWLDSWTECVPASVASDNSSMTSDGVLLLPNFEKFLKPCLPTASTAAAEAIRNDRERFGPEFRLVYDIAPELEVMSAERTERLDLPFDYTSHTLPSETPVMTIEVSVENASQTTVSTRDSPVMTMKLNSTSTVESPLDSPLVTIEGQFENASQTTLPELASDPTLVRIELPSEFLKEIQLYQYPTGELLYVLPPALTNDTHQMTKGVPFEDTSYASQTLLTNDMQSPALPNATASASNNHVTPSAVTFLPKRPVREGCKLSYDKIRYCTYCSKGLSKMSRHLLTVHRCEPEVTKIKLLPKKSKERCLLLASLCNEGDFKHNANALKSGGQLVIARRTQSHKPSDYLPCDKCLLLVLKSTLSIHRKKCFSGALPESVRHNDNADRPVNKYGHAVTHSKALLASAVLNSSEQPVAAMLSRMKDDDIKLIVMQDALIKKYAALRVESLGRKVDQKHHDMYRVSQGARTAARLVMEARKEEPGVTLSDLLKPECFDLVVRAAKSLAFSGENPPATLGRLIGNVVARVIAIKIGEALRCGDRDSVTSANEFKQLFDAEWNYKVNAVAAKMINTEKRNKLVTLPLTEDLVKLREFILQEMEKTQENLLMTKSSRDWTWLAKLCVSRLILFNKRRRAEVSELQLKDYTSRPDWKADVNGELRMAMTEVDSLMANRMDMVIAAGKSRKNVNAYVLLPPDTVRAIELMIATRAEVGIPTTNVFLFARTSADSPLTGNSDLTEVVRSCPNLSCPESIKSTALRKYMATVSQILDMTESELQMLATHMGHDAKTHKDFYRLSSHTLELTKISQILSAVEIGRVNEWKGKRIADINVEDLPDVAEPEERDDTPEINSESDVEPDNADLPDDSEPEENVEEKGKDQDDGVEPCRTTQRRANPSQTLPSSSRRKWDTDELDMLRRAFGSHLQPPTFGEIDALKSTCPKLRKRSRAQIKTRAWALIGKANANKRKKWI